jgi:uncharacterized protein (TIGR02001 family)
MKNIASITTLTLVAAAAMADAAPAAAPASAWSQSANLAITSNYIWRGVSQNTNSVALQGGFDVAHTSGLSAGIWASSITAAEGLEVDLYANYGFKVGKVDLSVGYIAYVYSGSSSSNLTELNVSATYAGVTAKISKEIANGSGSGSVNSLDYDVDYGYYYELAYTYSVPAVKGLDVGLHYGISDSTRTSKNAEDYSVTLTYPVAGFAASVAYSNTPGSQAMGSPVINGGLYSLTLKKTF